MSVFDATSPNNRPTSPSGTPALPSSELLYIACSVVTVLAIIIVSIAATTIGVCFKRRAAIARGTIQ